MCPLGLGISNPSGNLIRSVMAIAARKHASQIGFIAIVFYALVAVFSARLVAAAGRTSDNDSRPDFSARNPTTLFPNDPQALALFG